MLYSQIFSLSQNTINTRNYIINVENIEEKAFLNIFDLQFTLQNTHYLWIPCIFLSEIINISIIIRSISPSLSRKDIFTVKALSINSSLKKLCFFS